MLPRGLPKLACELWVSIQHNVLGEAMMFEHMGEKQPSRLLGCGTFFGGNKMCHLIESIHHHHDRIKSLMVEKSP
jgi:hypothetical protein